jgi:mRNA-degrading endonuclease toxin of MazEF toxin-antitoxin module
VVQADELLALSTVLVEQTTAVTPERLGKSAGRLSPQELNSLDRALVAVLGL